MNRFLASFIVAISFLAFACSNPKQPTAQQLAAGDPPAAKTATAEHTIQPPASPQQPQPAVQGEVVRLVPASVVASNFMDLPGDHHPKEHAIDGKANTAWCTHDSWKGEWIELTFAKNVTVTRVTFHTGWNYVSSIATSGDLFVKNDHVRTGQFLFDGATPLAFSVGQEDRQTTVAVPNTSAQKLRLLADSIWSGTTYNDYCISEIEVWGIQTP